MAPWFVIKLTSLLLINFQFDSICLFLLAEEFLITKVILTHQFHLKTFLTTKNTFRKLFKWARKEFLNLKNSFWLFKNLPNKPFALHHTISNLVLCDNSNLQILKLSLKKRWLHRFKISNTRITSGYSISDDMQLHRQQYWRRMNINLATVLYLLLHGQSPKINLSTTREKDLNVYHK